MPNIVDPLILANPVRVQRIKNRMGQTELASLVGIKRPALVAIEDGRTVAPRDDILRQMEQVFGLPDASLTHQLQAWRRAREEQGPVLSLSQRSVLQMTPADVTRTFASFAAWREIFAKTPTAFAIMLGLNHSNVHAYENGIRVNGMPESLQSSLLTVLKVDPGYLAALMALPPSKE
jgi:DNA-binding XRE family transcriptional regulator/DNA-binding transcriptional regulator YiaG